MANECIHLGPVLYEGTHDPVHGCSQFGACTLMDIGLKRKGQPMAVCAGCPKRQGPIDQSLMPAIPNDQKPIVIQPKTRLAYVTGTNLPQQFRIMEKMIWSARAVGVIEDFHAFSHQRTG